MIFRRMKSISFIDEVPSPCGRPQPMWTHWEILAIGLSGVLTATVAAPAKHTVRIDFIG